MMRLRSTVERQAKHHRPSAIDIYLSRRPELLSSALGWAVNLGLTVDGLFGKLTEAGCSTSRSAVARWRLKTQRRQPGPPSDRRLRLCIRIMTADDATLDAVDAVLGRN